MKNNGVTMIELVIVMIILILIATFAILPGLDTVDEGRFTRVYAEMKAIEESINGIINISDGTLNLAPYHNGQLSTDNINAYSDDDLPSSIKVEMISSGKTFYRLNGVNDVGYTETVPKALGLSTIKRNYIISFDPVSIDVILVGGYDAGESKIYTLEQVEYYNDYGEIK
jgi:type II secretory pathway pseudopilin PulG